MLYTIILTLHVTGALAMLLVVGLAIRSLLQHSIQQYRSHAIQLAGGLIIQTGSGVALILVASQNLGLLAYCGRLSIYLLVVGMVELWLWADARRLQSSQL